MKVNKPKVAKWKLYSGLVALIAAVTFGFSVLTVFVSYPTAEHRRVGQEIAKIDDKALTSENFEKLINSDRYRELSRSTENNYTKRMSIGSGILSMIINVAIVVALYRYLRRHYITTKPVGVTVLIITIAGAIEMLPSIYASEFITGIKTEPFMMVALLIAAPFAIGFSALITFLIAKITEWHYNRSHGFVEE